jgi:pyruvate dehydrogenase E2 component (dihydrolipoamide acetyltransferase)
MPALSPTMTEGKVVKWLVKVGDQVQPGDSIADIETDKATVGFEVQEKGYIAKINEGAVTVQIGTPVVVITRKSESVKSFSQYKFGEAGSEAGSSQAEP